MTAMHAVENANRQKKRTRQPLELRNRSQNFHCRSLRLRAAESRNLRKRENSRNDLFAGQLFDLIDGNCVRDIEAAGFRAPQAFQMRAAPKCLTDIVRISSNIESFAAEHTEVDVGQRYLIDAVAINMNETRLAFDHFSLTREFVERHAALLFRRDHRRHLVKIAAKLVESGANFFLAKLRHRL